ncbi:hypothetical protein AQJ84_23900 [Streptomyces resistomycificus]|nr:hypothetical protein AQJ84_23900 [Streptomyces resistomycificus]
MAHLEWWANTSTCLARIPVSVEAATGDAWRATALPELDPETRDSLAFLIDLSPVFTLRFKNDAVVEVVAELAGDLNRLHLRTTPSPHE